jgi:IS30 family transposase
MWGLHLEGFSVREIAREVGCSRSTVHRVIQRLSADYEQQLAALRAVSATLRARLEKLGIDTVNPHPETVAVMAALAENPTDALAEHRIRYLPRTDEWWAGRNALGI